MRLILCITLATLFAMPLQSCKTASEEPVVIDWTQVQQAVQFALEKLPVIIASMNDSGLLSDDPDERRRSIDDLTDEISSIAVKYLQEQGRLPTIAELVEGLKPWIELRMGSVPK